MNKPLEKEFVHRQVAPFDPNGPDAYDVDDEIDLIEYWRILMRYKWLILLLVAVGAGGGGGAAVNTKPSYRAEVSLAPVGEEKGSSLSALAGEFGGLAALAGINLFGGGSGGGLGRTEAAIATLKSRVFTGAFIKDENLMPVLFADRWNPATKTWQVGEGKTPPTESDAFEFFDKSVRAINPDKKTGLIVLSIEWENPVLAAEWANKLVARINAHQKQSAITEAQKSIDYLNSQLRQTSVVEMQQAIFRLVEVQTKQIMLANVRDEFVFKIIDPAVVPEKNIKPKPSTLVPLGAVLGLVLGIFLAFLLSFIKRQRESHPVQAAS